jgi:hypothetical protein
MTKNSITPLPLSSSLMVHNFGCCVPTLPQNGKVGLMICIANNVKHSLLFQTSIPTHYWVESLHAASYLLNLLPTKVIITTTPHFALFDTTPSYFHLRVFRCACYPNLSATTPISLPSTLVDVSSSATPLSITSIGASISPLIVCLSLDTLSSMSHPSPLPLHPALTPLLLTTWAPYLV